jgi:hypothetical protein
MNTLTKLTFIFIFLFSSLAVIHAQSAAKISIQGTLKDANGAAVEDGTYTVEFRLYNVETGGTIQWFEVASVESAGGIYSHYLGSINPLDAEVFDQTLFLGIKVGAYELTPRTELTYAPYTFASNTALSALKVICSGAVGDVKYSILNPTQFAAENGDCWVPMDGGSMFGTKLASILQTNTKPNASGLFLRAHEYTEGNDPGRSPSSSIASVQSDELGSHGHGHSLSFSGSTSSAGAHSHTVRISWRGFTTQAGGGAGLENSQDDDFTASSNTTGDHTHSVSGPVSGSINNAGGSETRPKNMNLYVYIRVN